MVRLSNADGEAQHENGPRIVDEKQPLNNGIADRAYPIIEHIKNADQTDTVVRVPHFNHEKLPLPVYQKIPKRKYRTYDDTGIRNRKPTNLTPLPTSRFCIEQRIRRKTGLTRCGLILTVLCVLLIIILFVICIILWMESPSLKKICVMPSCLRSSAEMLPKISLDEKPCVNFRGYACGNWFSTKPLPEYHTEWNLKAIMLRNYRQEVLGLLTRNPLTSKVTTSKKMKIFYDSCMKGTRTTRGNSHEIKDYITDRLMTELSTGEWVIFEKTISDSWNVFDVVGSILSETSTSPFFRVEVGSDPMDATRNVIYLKPPTSILADPYFHTSKGSSKYNETIKLLTKYVKDVFYYLDATKLDAQLYSSRIVEFEKSLASYIVAGMKNKTQPRYSRMKVRNLDHEFSPMEFYRMLTKMFKALSLEVTVLVENVGYFKELSKFIFRTASRPNDLNAYTIWRYVADYVPYLSADLEGTRHMFETEMTDEHEPMPRWEFCTSLMQKYGNYYLLALYENETTTAEKEKIHSAVSQIFSETVSVVRRSLKRNNFVIEQAAKDRLSQVKIQIGLPPEMLQDNYIETHYDRFSASSDLGENIRLGEYFRNLNFGKRLTQPKEEDKFLDNMISMPTAITYNPASNYIVVPWPVLQRPYFEKDYPLASLYGGIGFEIAKALIRSLFPSPTGEEIDRLSQSLVGRNFSSLNLTNTEEYVVTLTALKFSYEALEEQLSSVEDICLPGMEMFRNEELFFLSYVQSICSVRTNKLAISEQLSNNVNDFTIAISGLLELVEFTALYECQS